MPKKTGLRGSPVTNDLRRVGRLARAWLKRVDPLGWPTVLAAHIYAVALIAAAAWLTGCAHGHIEKFDPQTGKKILEIESWVLGKGRIGQVGEGYIWVSEGTGLSEEGGDALGKISEGAVRGLVPLP